VRAAIRRIRKQEGFLLIELLIAMIVLAVGLLALMGAFSTGYVAINRASTIGAASVLADKQMETYRGMSWSALVGAASTPPPPQTVPGPDGRSYTVQTSFRCWQTSYSSSQFSPVEVNPCSQLNAPGPCIGSTRTDCDKTVTPTVTVQDASGRTWATENSTFDRLTGSTSP
jgi:type II secretory pathway pseudopilin PulG